MEMNIFYGIRVIKSPTVGSPSPSRSTSYLRHPQESLFFRSVVIHAKEKEFSFVLSRIST